MRKSPLEFWSHQKEYILGLLQEEPLGKGLQEEVDYAEEQLQAIAEGVYEEPVILHGTFTIGLADRQDSVDDQEMLNRAEFF